MGVRMYACMYVTLCVCYYVCCITGACQAQTGPAGYIYYYYLSMLYVCVWCVCLVFCGACSVVFSYMTREIRVARIRLATIKKLHARSACSSRLSTVWRGKASSMRGSATASRQRDGFQNSELARILLYCIVLYCVVFLC